VKPLYTLRDVERTLPLLDAVPYDRPVKVNGHVQAVFHDAGHILGSAMIELRWKTTAPRGGSSLPATWASGTGPSFAIRPFSPRPITSSWNRPTATHARKRRHDRVAIAAGDFRNGRGGGKVIIPIFAIERAQELIYYLNQLLQAGQIPKIPVFLDSPMAAAVNDVFRRHRECFDAEAEQFVADGQPLLKFPSLHVVRSVQESMAINTLKGPAIIMATSGMCTAGRIKHHLAHHIGNPPARSSLSATRRRGRSAGRFSTATRRSASTASTDWCGRVRQIQGISAMPTAPAC